jgi:hypothetical protein
MKRFLWILAGICMLAVLATLSDRDRTTSSTGIYSVATTPNVGAEFTPPRDFRGIKWGAALPSKARLLATVLRGCPNIAEVELLKGSDIIPCTHSHITTDDMDLFAQSQNVLSMYGVRASTQLLEWSYRRFWAGHIFIYNYNDTELNTLRNALLTRFGPPHLSTSDGKTYQWIWRSQKLLVNFLCDPVAKHSVVSLSS